MDQAELRILREFCPRLLCHWPDEAAEQFVDRCHNFSITTICWIWDWLLNQIKGINPPSSHVSLTLANFLLKKLPKSLKIPSFAALRLLNNLKEANYTLVSIVSTEIANRNPFTAPGSLAKCITEAIEETRRDPSVPEMVSSLSYLLSKTLHNFHFRTSFKAIETILDIDRELLYDYFGCDNFLNLIYFTISLPFHRTLSHFYSSIHFLNCLRLNQKIEIYNLSTQNHSIFIHLINWSDRISDHGVSYLFYNIHNYYLSSYDVYVKKTPGHDRDKLCFTVFLLTLFCRNLGRTSWHMFDSLQRIISRANSMGLFSLLPMEKEPIHITKCNKFLNKLFNILLETTESNKDEIVSKILWNTIELLLNYNLDKLDLNSFLTTNLKHSNIATWDFENRAAVAIKYIIDIFPNFESTMTADLTYSTIVPNLMYKLFKVGDLYSFFKSLTRDMPFYLFLNCDLIHVAFKCGYQAQNIAQFLEPIYPLMKRTALDSRNLITLRLVLSSFLLSYNIKDNENTKTFLLHLLKYVPQLNFQIRYNALEDTSLFLLVFSLFMILRKTDACFSYSQSSEFCVVDYIGRLTDFIFNIKAIINLDSDLSTCQLILAEHCLIHISLYFAYRIHRSQELEYISLVETLGQDIHELAVMKSNDQAYHFYLIYITNPHLLELFGLTLPPELSLLIRALTEHKNLPLIVSIVRYFVGNNAENLCVYLRDYNISNENMIGLSRLLNILEEPRPEILEHLLKVFEDKKYLDKECLFSPFLLRKSLRNVIAKHFINELILPVEFSLCSKCNQLTETLKTLKLTYVTLLSGNLFTSIDVDLYYDLISNSIAEICKADEIPEHIHAFMMYVMLNKRCDFLLPPLGDSKCHFCIENKRKMAIVKVIKSLDEHRSSPFLKNVIKHKSMEDGVSKLLNTALNTNEALFEINEFLDVNTSEGLSPLCYYMIRFMAKDSRDDLDEEVTADFLMKSERLTLECINNMEYSVNSIQSLLFYLKLYLNKSGVTFTGPVPIAVKNIVTDLDVAEELLRFAQDEYKQNSPPNVLLNLFLCDSVFKLCKKKFNPSTEPDCPLFKLLNGCFKRSLDFICGNPHLIETGKLYVFLCKIICSLYDYMRKSALNTTGYINIYNHLAIIDMLITLSNLVPNLLYIMPEDSVGHSYMCIYSLLNYSSDGTTAQTVRLLNLWINSIPMLIIACKTWFPALPSYPTIDMILDIVKLLRNRKIMTSTKRYVPLFLTIAISHTRELTLKSTDDVNFFVQSVKQRVQLAIDACGPQIGREWFIDMPIEIKNYLKAIGVKKPSDELKSGGSNIY